MLILGGNDIAVNRNVEPELYLLNDTDIVALSPVSLLKDGRLKNNLKTRKPSRIWRLFRKHTNTFDANPSNRW